MSDTSPLFNVSSVLRDQTITDLTSENNYLKNNKTINIIGAKVKIIPHSYNMGPYVSEENIGIILSISDHDILVLYKCNDNDELLIGKFYHRFIVVIDNKINDLFSSIVQTSIP